MSLYERLYDEAEKAKVRFVGFISDNGRYDYGIVYTNTVLWKAVSGLYADGTLLVAFFRRRRKFRLFEKNFPSPIHG